MVMGDDWVNTIGKPLRDMVPPAKNRGDPLPPESMKLREKLIREHEEKMAAKRADAEGAPAPLKVLRTPVLPVDPEAEARVDELVASRSSNERPRPIYADVLAMALKLPTQEKLDLIMVLIESLKELPDSSSDEGS